MAIPEDAPVNIFQPDGRMNLSVLTEMALIVLNESVQQARDTRWDSVRSPHVFMGLLAAPDEHVREWGRLLGADIDQMLEQFQELFRQEEMGCDTIIVLSREFLSDNAIRLLREAHRRASQNRRSRFTPMDLLIALLTAEDSIVAECFQRNGVTAAKLTELAVLAEQEIPPH